MTEHEKDILGVVGAGASVAAVLDAVAEPDLEVLGMLHRMLDREILKIF